MTPRLAARRTRVAVFGGTGPLGLLLVRELLGRGCDVVALARDVRRLPTAEQRLTVVEAQLTDEAAIRDALTGADAVASALGPHGRSPGLPIAAGLARIVSAMDEVGVRRIVQVSTASAHSERDAPDIRQRLLVAAVRTIWRSAYAEIVGMARVLRVSDLDWTLVRVPVLRTSHRAAGPVRVGYPGRDGIGFFVSRESVSAFMADCVTGATYVEEAPMICDAPRAKEAGHPS